MFSEKFASVRTPLEAVREWLFSLPLIAGRQAQIIILEILQCIPVVIIFAFFDLGKNISFSDSLLDNELSGKVDISHI